MAPMQYVGNQYYLPDWLVRRQDLLQSSRVLDWLGCFQVRQRMTQMISEALSVFERLRRENRLKSGSTARNSGEVRELEDNGARFDDFYRLGLHLRPCPQIDC